MRKLSTLFLMAILINPSFARGGRPDTEADYIVPTSSQFIKYSRFKVDIVDRFKGPQTQKISYIFPEFLIGEANRTIEFTRVANTENDWSSPELNAKCAALGEEFTCNIYVNKLNSTSSNLTAESAIRNLSNMNLTSDQLQGYTGVIEAFYSHEPAGFMTYDID